MENYTFRLKPGQDLFDSIETFLQEKTIRAGCIRSGVGSLTHVRLRFADRNTYAGFDGRFEIVSMTGTLSIHGSRLHIAVADGEGQTIGGHLESGCKIYTTAEIVIAAIHEEVYKREFTQDSGYDELAVHDM